MFTINSYMQCSEILKIFINLILEAKAQLRILVYSLLTPSYFFGDKS